MTPQKTAVCTIVAKNYLPYARALMRTLARVHPDWDRYVLLADRRDGRFDPNAEAFELIEIEDLEIHNKHRLLFQYSLLELNTAAKPWLLTRLFDSHRYDRVVYFDPDILVYAPLAEVERAWAQGALAALTPHLTGRLRDDKYPGERDILLSGTYNLGFIALARHAQLESFLEYWREKSLTEFAVDIDRGLFTDQKWMDPVPGMFPDVGIIRHEGYNVAYWNLPHRRVVRGPIGFEVNGQPLVFFHFSGLDPTNPDGLSRHQDRLTLADIGDAAALVRSYCDMVRESGHEQCRDWPYAFNCFDDGTPIMPEMRAAYRSNAALQQRAGPNPFRPGALDFNQVLIAGARHQPPITLLMDVIYAARPDVREVFRDIRGRDRVGFARWFLSDGARQHAIPDHYLELVSASLDTQPALPGRTTPTRPSVGGFVSRLGRALDIRALLSGLTADATRARRTLPTHPPTPAARLSLEPDVAGFYEQSDEDRAQGMTWMGPRAAVRLGRLDGRSTVLTISGEHSSALHKQAGNPGSLRLAITLNGLDTGTARLTTGGSFRVTMPLEHPPALLDYPVILAMTCDHTFVPAKIGLNPDMRTLSVRVKEVRIGEHAVLDFGRHGRVYEAVSEPDVPRFNIIGYAKADSGVGQSARLCAAAARAAALSAPLVDFREVLEADHVRLSGLSIDCRVNVLHVNADQVPTVANLIGAEYLRDRYNIGVWHWELGEFPDEWLESFAPLQEIWAPSQFIFTAVAAKSPVPVVHMPHGIEVPRTSGSRRVDFGLPTDTLLFLVMYDMRSFHARKNPAAAIESFARAFPSAHGATLIIKIRNGASSPADFAQLRHLCNETPGVILIDEIYTADRVHELQSLCDCYVSLHRSEGFGFNLAESMALGKPVIATGWSGNMDFMDTRNSCLVDYALTPILVRTGPYAAGQLWAEPDIDHAAWHMKRLAADQSLREAIGCAAAEHIATHFSPHVAGMRMRQRLRIIDRISPPTRRWPERGGSR